jgi:hypothetical protein
VIHTSHVETYEEKKESEERKRRAMFAESSSFSPPT